MAKDETADLGEVDRAAVLERSLDRLLAWIGAANERVNTILAIATAMLGVLAALAPKVAADWSVQKAIPSALAVLLLLASLVLAFLATFPRTTGTKGSLIFFGGIVARDVAQYRGSIASLTQAAYIEELVVQTHRNAEIADLKYMYLRWSMRALFASVVLWLLSVFLLYQG